MIKDNDLIADMQPGNKANTKTYKLININKQNKKTKLGDVFNYLPCGIIDKTITGIGGTSLELDAARDSIIVEPYVMTAYNKAQSASRNNSFKIHFYGKAPKGSVVVEKLSTKNIYPTYYSEYADAELNTYLKHCKDNNQNIKIICVTDQLESLKNYFINNSSHPFDNFHLTFDEIDCFQSSSTFRNIMDRCVEIYTMHPPQKRTLLSATISNFSDPSLNNEPITKIIYSKFEQEAISLVKINKSSFANEVLAILDNLSKNPTTKSDKIVIACNHIKLCLKTIELLEEKGFGNIKILCSEDKQEATKSYFDILPPSGILPGKINFITSRYFNGIDILEEYHSIIIVNGLKPNLRLSPSFVYQINGRGRFGLKSRTILYNLTVPKKIEINNYNTLEEQAKELCMVYELMHTLKNSKYPNNVNASEEIINLLEKGNKKFYSLCYRNLNGDFIPSHLKIDAKLVEENIIQVYSKKNAFKEGLKNWYILKDQIPLAKGINTVVSKSSIEEASSLIEIIENNIKKSKSNDILNKISLDNKGIGQIARIYELSYLIENIDLNKVKSLVVAAAKSKAFSYELKKILFNFETHVNVLNKGNTLNKLMNKYFEADINKLYDRESLEMCCDEFIDTARNLKNTAKYQAEFIDLLPKSKKLIVDSILNLETKKERTASLLKDKSIQVSFSEKKTKQKIVFKIKGFKKLDIFL